MTFVWCPAGSFMMGSPENAITDSALAAGCGEFRCWVMTEALRLIAAIIFCGVIITKRCENPTARLLAGGITTVIALARFDQYIDDVRTAAHRRCALSHFLHIVEAQCLSMHLPSAV